MHFATRCAAEVTATVLPVVTPLEERPTQTAQLVQVKAVVFAMLVASPQVGLLMHLARHVCPPTHAVIAPLVGTRPEGRSSRSAPVFIVEVEDLWVTAKLEGIPPVARRLSIA